MKIGSVLASALMVFGISLGSAPALAADVMRVTVTSCVCFLPANLAIKRGWLAEELKKIDMTLAIQNYEDGPSQTAAFLSGSLDMAVYGTAGASLLLARNADIKIFMLSDNEIDTEGLVVKKSAGIKSVKDLVGKKVGLTAGTTSDYGLRAALKEAGVDAKSVKIIGIAPTALGAAWARGEIDASYVWEPIMSRLVNDGGQKLQTIGDLAKATGGKYKIMNFYVASGEFAKRRPDAIKAYVKAVDRAILYIRGNTKQVAAEYLKDLGAKSVEQALEQINGEEYFLSTEQMTPALMGDGTASGKIANLLLDVWQFSYDNRNITVKPDLAIVKKAIETQFLK
jgi:taurine transport system substrate-binding protein